MLTEFHICAHSELGILLITILFHEDWDTEPIIRRVCTATMQLLILVAIQVIIMNGEHGHFQADDDYVISDFCPHSKYCALLIVASFHKTLSVNR